MGENSGLGCACGNKERCELEMWWTEESVLLTDEIKGSDLVSLACVGLLAHVRLSALGLISNCLTDGPPTQ